MKFVRKINPSQIRNPRAATVTNVGSPSLRWRGASPNTWDAGTAIRNALYANVYVYACARARAQDLSSLPLRVGADPEKPKDFDPKHPLARLLGPAPGGPTMNISARRLIAWSLIQYDICGRMVWEIADPVRTRADGVPIELWPVPASRITPIESDGGAQWFRGFEYEDKKGNRRNLPANRVMYHWRPGHEDFREPESLIQASGLNISIAIMQDRYDHAFLINDARPAAVVVHEEFQIKKERDSFRRQFLDTHRGVDNAGKVAFVEATRDGATPKESLLIQTLGLSQKDAEFIERTENQIRAICVSFATPLSRLADSSRRTFANAERETMNYWRNAIKPAGVEFAEGINVQVMPLLGDSSNVCWFDTTGIPELEPPKRFAVTDIPKLLEFEVITRNEARTAIELKGIGKEGDIFGTFEDPPEQQSTKEPAPVANPQKDPTMPSRSLVGVQTRSMADAAPVAIAELTHLWATAVNATQQAQTRAILRRLEGKRGRQAKRGEDLSTVHDRTYWYNTAYEQYTSLLRSVYIAATVATLGAGDRVPYGGQSTEASAWLARHAGVLAARFVDDVQSVLRQATPDNAEGLLDALAIEVRHEDIEHLYRSALTTCRVGGVVVSAETAANAVVMLARGDISLDEAMAVLA